MSRKAMTVTNVSITRGQVHTISQLLIQNDLVIMRPPYGRGGALSDTAISPSVCPVA